MEPTHATSRWEYEIDGKKAWTFCDSTMSLPQFYEFAVQQKNWAFQQLLKQEEEAKKQEEENLKVLNKDESCKDECEEVQEEEKE